MRATIREKETKPEATKVETLKLITLLKSENKIWTYAELCRRLKKKPNQLRALIDVARCYSPIMTYEKKGYKICTTKDEKEQYKEHIENQIKHKLKHLRVFRGV